jgi:hypothetical protein
VDITEHPCVFCRADDTSDAISVDRHRHMGEVGQTVQRCHRVSVAARSDIQGRRARIR